MLCCISPACACRCTPLQVSKLFPGGEFPEGEVQPHAGDFNTYRTTSEEKRHLERLSSDVYETVREAAEVHRTVRKYAQSIIRPGIKLADMCEAIENMNRQLVGENGLKRGAFTPPVLLLLLPRVVASSLLVLR